MPGGGRRRGGSDQAAARQRGRDVESGELGHVCLSLDLETALAHHHVCIGVVGLGQLLGDERLEHTEDEVLPVHTKRVILANPPVTDQLNVTKLGHHDLSATPATARVLDRNGLDTLVASRVVQRLECGRLSHDVVVTATVVVGGLQRRLDGGDRQPSRGRVDVRRQEVVETTSLTALRGAHLVLGAIKSSLLDAQVKGLHVVHHLLVQLVRHTVLGDPLLGTADLDLAAPDLRVVAVLVTTLERRCSDGALDEDRAKADNFSASGVRGGGRVGLACRTTRDRQGVGRRVDVGDQHDLIVNADSVAYRKLDTLTRIENN